MVVKRKIKKSRSRRRVVRCAELERWNALLLTPKASRHKGLCIGFVDSAYKWTGPGLNRRHQDFQARNEQYLICSRRER